MLRRLGREILGFILWTHERGSFRYDIMVGLILAFIFLTPRSFFHDRQAPSSASPIRASALALQAPEPQQIVVLEERQGVFQVDAALLGQGNASPEARARSLLQAFTGKPVRIRRLEPVHQPDGRLVAYKVWVEAQ